MAAATNHFDLKKNDVICVVQKTYSNLLFVEQFYINAFKHLLGNTLSGGRLLLSSSHEDANLYLLMGRICTSSNELKMTGSSCY